MLGAILLFQLAGFCRVEIPEDVTGCPLSDVSKTWDQGLE